MTSKEKVLSVYPDARIVSWMDGACGVYAEKVTWITSAGGKSHSTVTVYRQKLKRGTTLGARSSPRKWGRNDW